MVGFKKKFISIILSIGLMASACGCDSSETGKENKKDVNNQSLTGEMDKNKVDGKEIDDVFTGYTADFAIDLFKESVIDGVVAGKNVLISPLSVLTALSMTANGAGDSLLPEMEAVLCSGNSLDEHNKYMYTYNNNLNESETVKFNVANSVWIKDDEEAIKVEDTFIQECTDYYDADIFMAEFDDSTVNDINSWVNDETEEMIPTLLNDIPEEAVMYLINAIAFEGEWETEYEERQIIEDDEFTSFNGTSELVDMLSSTESIFVQDADAKGFVKSYKDGKYAFMAILPNEGVSLDNYISEMTGDSFLSLYQNRQYKDVIVKLPEFTYEYDTELSPYLSSMGMGTAFTEAADFSDMAITGNPLYISKVLHKTFIQVDRHGTKAAAVTSVEMVSESCAEYEEPEYVILDRPFIYSIIDTETGLPIFIGVLNTTM